MHCLFVAYPNNEGGTFDFTYYLEKHIPMVSEMLGDNFVKAEVRKGLASGDGSAAPFLCVANIWIKSNMLESPRDAAVVSTIIDLGSHLGLEVIAEGVETLAQRDWLIDHGCSIMQGFLVSPGLPVAKAESFPLQVDWASFKPQG